MTPDLRSQPPGSVIAHVCLFRLLRPITPEEMAQLRGFEARFLARPACSYYRFSQNMSDKSQGFDLVLFSKFSDRDSLRAYVQTEDHAELAGLMASFVMQTIVADATEGLHHAPPSSGRP